LVEAQPLLEHGGVELLDVDCKPFYFLPALVGVAEVVEQSAGLCALVNLLLDLRLLLERLHQRRHDLALYLAHQSLAEGLA
jgi:hypothetical protein